ncbi:MAG: DUF2171 domain-containing protein [Rhizobiales bacterium]|nr:DUF2171 domain-containing protein [Hyphomicrobiales bacterium]
MFDASQIREHMEVVGADGRHVGTVDHLEDARQIKLTASDSADGEHHFLALELIDRVDDKVHLKVPADEAQLQIH